VRLQACAVSVTINPEDNRYILCPRCKRWTKGWLLMRGDGNRCSPKDWARCIREPEAIIAAEKAKKEKGR
jgi:hypothetical protein